jgi:acetyltransferase EpsM
VKPVIIFGAGGHGRVVLDICNALYRPVIGFLDDTLEPGTSIQGVPVLGNAARLDQVLLASAEIVIAIGSIGGSQLQANSLRRTIGEDVLARGGHLGTLIHPSAVVSREAHLGKGTTVSTGALIITGARVGRHCQVHTGAIVDHDCVLEDGVQIGPAACLSSGVRCGEESFLGAGSAVAPGINIGARTRVGLGAGVLSDLPADVLAVGTPARPTHAK